MSLLGAITTQAAHIALLLLAAPTVMGLVEALAARLAGRRPPSPRQPWRDLIRLTRKQPVRAENASPPMHAAPLLSLAVAGTIASLIPSFALGMVCAPLADLLVIAAFFALGRVVRALAAMDSGTAPRGIAAAQTARWSVHAEPALLLVMFALAIIGGGNLDQLLAMRQDGSWPPGPAGALAIAALAILGWADTAHDPSEDAATGRDLAPIRLAHGLRLLAWCDLISALALPFGIAEADSGPLAWSIGLLAWAGRLLLCAGLLALARVLAPAHRPATALAMAAVLGMLAAGLALVGAGAA